VESNHRPPGSEPGVTTNSNCLGSRNVGTSLDARKFGEEESNLRRLRPRLRLGARARETHTSPSPNKSALRESNPPRQLGRLAPLPIGQGHGRRKEGESNSQGSSLDRFRGGCHRQLACPSTSCGVRNRTCDGAVNSRLPVPARAPPQSVKAAGFEPAISCSRGRRNPRLSHALNSRAPSGSRTRTSAMARRQAAATLWALTNVPNCQRTREHRLGLGPRFPPYEGGLRR
jgi:hypothetical protein